MSDVARGVVVNPRIPDCGVIVCGPDPAGYRKRYVRCPTCECITEMVAHYDLWYGTTFRCCRCGDAWCDGEMYPRPFARGWRKTAVQQHRRLWDRASHGPPPDFSEYGLTYGEAS